MAPGAVSKAAYDFTPTGNVVDRATLDADFCYQSFFGNQQCNTGSDGIDGSHGATFTVARTYPASSPYNLLNFTSRGLDLGVICSLNDTAKGCTQGNVYGTLLRPPVIIQKGDIVLVRMQGGNSPEFYTAPAEYGGAQTTPGPGGNPYNAPAGRVYDDNCYDENDGQDDYRVSGIPIGCQLKMGVEPIDQYAANGGNPGNKYTPNGECYHKAPYLSYAANGPDLTFFQNFPYTPYSELDKTDFYNGLHDYVWWRKNDGSNLINYYFDGRLVETEYYEQSPTNPGWSLEMQTQTIPTFVCGGSPCTGPFKPNDGGPIIGGRWSTTLAVLKVITGSIAKVAKPQDANGANPADAINGLPNYPP